MKLENVVRPNGQKFLKVQLTSGSAVGMSLASREKWRGRPPEEGGHDPLNLSVSKPIREMLEKIDNKSKFIEDTIRPVLKNYDPGEPCDILCEVTARVQDRIAKANRNGDFEKVTAYSNMGERLQELSQLCGCPAPKDSSTRLDARKLDQA